MVPGQNQLIIHTEETSWANSACESLFVPLALRFHGKMLFCHGICSGAESLGRSARRQHPEMYVKFESAVTGDDSMSSPRLQDLSSHR